MKRFFTGALVIVALMFGGCGPKELPSIISKDKQYAESLRYTKKVSFDISMEEKALFIATYLNPIEHKKGNEEFFVRTFIDNDFEEESKAGLHHPGVRIALNGQKPMKIIELTKENQLVKKMPFTQTWYRYYLVVFPENKSKELKLKITFSPYGSKELLFLKPIEE